jgi:hypothetical protein
MRHLGWPIISSGEAVQRVGRYGITAAAGGLPLNNPERYRHLTGDPPPASPRPLRIGLRAQAEPQHTSTHDLSMRDPSPVQRRSVQPGCLNVPVLAMAPVDLHRERLAVFKMNFHVIEQRAPQRVDRLARIHRIKTHRAENVPGRHLAGVLVPQPASRPGPAGRTYP